MIVAAAATTALSLSGTWASADSGSLATADSPAALSGDMAAWDGLADPEFPEPGFGDSPPARNVASAASSSHAVSSAQKAHRAAPVSPAPVAATPTHKPSEQPCACYGEDEAPAPVPTPSKPPKPPHPPKATPPATPKPTPTRDKPEKPPVRPTPEWSPTPPEMAETGTEGTLGGMAASAALLAAGTVLFRRGRAASRR
ncbi:hypothetical protein AQI88_25105 [Streptomyces cellostaticus]|uniref:Gram-positive cocci surface proteins LPxTG domain-containing protein n=1 Tax=Streptomyces cellostaticus TaxID=67285 RepID=A0A117PVF4_9ACTN|nr:hypothetical protein AQI88_25105 [Streptomyces cellostaticus]